VANRTGRIDREQLTVAHSHPDRLAAVEAGRIYTHFLFREKPADCQRLKPSLAVPALPPADGDQVLRRQVSEWREGFDVVRAWMLPHTRQPHVD